MTHAAEKIGPNCPACGEGTLQPRTELETVEYHGQSGEIELRFAVCDTCGSDLTGADDARHNKRAMNAFKKRVDGLLTGDEIKAFRDRMHLTQRLTAELIGGGEVAFSRYESDDVVQSAPMDTALRLCMASPYNLLTLSHLKGIGLPPEVIARVTNDHRDRLVFMTRAIREHLDQELSVAINRPSTRDFSIVESATGLHSNRRRFQRWGNA
jgi:HTH-type transcriptional regulator / antitoxin MqsA